MKKFLVILSLLGLSLFAKSAMAANIIDYGSNWGYYQASGSEYTWNAYDGSFYTANLGSFDWSKINKVSNGAFGNSEIGFDPTVQTYWSDNTGLALEKTFNLSGKLNNAEIDYGIDNGAVIYVNGVEVSRLIEEGYGWQNEHSLTLASSLFKTGSNMIQVLAEDHGGATWFDLQLKGDVTGVTPTPEPSAIILGLMSLGSMLGLKRRKI